MYRNHPYKIIGPQPSDFTEEGKPNVNSEVLDKFKSMDLLKKQLWEGIGNQVRPQAWKILLKYLPLDPNQRLKQLQIKRSQYRDLVERFSEEKLSEQQTSDNLEVIK